jgi:hypothetical protein
VLLLFVLLIVRQPTQIKSPEMSLKAVCGYLQDSFGVVYCTTAALSTCRGTQDAVSLAVDWKFAAKFDAYAGFMYSQVNNGLASGFLHRTAIDPTAGIRFQF